MAVSKKRKKWLIVGGLLLIVGFFYRPVKAGYVSEAGTSCPGTDVIKTGLISAKYQPGGRNTDITGTIGLLGKSIVWSNGSVWTAV